VSCFGAFAASREQNVVKRVVVMVFLNWVARGCDLELKNLKDENLD